MEIVKEWNKFVKLMIATKKTWENLMSMTVYNELNWNKLSPKAQKTLSIANTRAKFEVAIPRLIAYWRGYGGLDNLIIPVEKKKPIKEEVEDDRQES